MNISNRNPKKAGLRIFQNGSYRLSSLHDQLNRCRFLSGNAVKFLAVFTMFVDHFNKIVLSWLQGSVWKPMMDAGLMSVETYTRIDHFTFYQLYGIGTIAFPLFCFLLSEGFCHTAHRKQYFLLMAVFAVISELPFDLAFFGLLSYRKGTYPFYWGYQNVFFTLLLGLAAMWCIERFHCESGNKQKRWKGLLLQIVSVATMAGAASLLRSDYDSYGVLLIVAFYIGRNNRIYQVLLYLLLFTVTTNAQPTIYMLVACLFILLYNGKRGKLRLKYAFYAFYPVHITLLYLVTFCFAPVGQKLV